MALATAKVRVFQTVNDMQAFIQTDADLTAILYIFQDNSGAYVLVYSIA
jgi:hypothetical protein